MTSPPMRVPRAFTIALGIAAAADFSYSPPPSRAMPPGAAEAAAAKAAAAEAAAAGFAAALARS